jgi:AraC-like DNA-binding protein
MAVDNRLKLAYLHGGVVQYRAGETLGPRVLNDYELVLILEGNVTYQPNQRNYAAPPGSAILARPGFRETYQWDPLGLTRHAFFHFQVEQMPNAWPAESSWPVVRTQPDPVVLALFRHILHRFYLHPDWPTHPPGRDDCCMVETLINVLLEEHGCESTQFERDRPTPVNRAIKMMRHAIEEEHHRSVDLGRLAKAAGVNEKHLCRLFQKALGYPPMETYRLLCLQLSLALLARSNLTIKQIAHRCGFDDPAYFSRYFSRVFRCSPRQLRRGLSEGMLPPASPLPVDLTPRIAW